MEPIPDQPLTVLVSNFTNALHKLLEHMKIAWTEPLPDYYVPLKDPVCTRSLTKPITAVQRDELRLNKRRFACMQFHFAQSQRSAVNDTKDWQETVQIGTAFEDRRDKVPEVLEPHQKEVGRPR